MQEERERSRHGCGSIRHRLVATAQLGCSTVSKLPLVLCLLRLQAVLSLSRAGLPVSVPFSTVWSWDLICPPHRSGEPAAQGPSLLEEEQGNQGDLRRGGVEGTASRAQRCRGWLQ